MKQLTILVISHNHEQYLKTLLSDLNNYSNFIFKIVILFNILPKEKIDLPKKIKKKIIIKFNKKPMGLSKNINKLLRYCKTELVAIVNPDIRIKKNIFNTIISNFKTDKRLALVSPTILDEEGNVQDTKRSYPSIINLIKREIFKIKEKNKGKDWLAGMFSVFKTSVLKKIKFDDNFFLYCEDVDISLRLSQKKYNFLLDKKISVVHVAQKTSRKNLRFTFFHIKSYFYLWRKHGFFK